MRPVLVAIGAVLAIIGLILIFYGVPGVSNGGTDTVPPAQYLVLQPTGQYSLGNTLTINVDWTSQSSSSITVTVYSCATDSTCANAAANTIISRSGVTGSLTFTATKGDYYAVGVSNQATITYGVSAGFGGLFFNVAIVFLALGLLVVIIGGALRTHRQSSSGTRVWSPGGSTDVTPETDMISEGPGSPPTS